MEVNQELWEAAQREYLQFSHLRIDQRPFSSPDLCAFAFLDKRFPAINNRDMVSGATHDKIWLRLSIEEIVQLTADEVTYLARCGVMYDEGCESLKMFV